LCLWLKVAIHWSVHALLDLSPKASNKVNWDGVLGTLVLLASSSTMAWRCHLALLGQSQNSICCCCCGWRKVGEGMQWQWIHLDQSDVRGQEPFLQRKGSPWWQRVIRLSVNLGEKRYVESFLTNGKSHLLRSVINKTTYHQSSSNGLKCFCCCFENDRTKSIIPWP